MTAVAVLADPPREGLVLPTLPRATPLTAADAVGLYEAALLDTLAAVQDSGGELIVNYRDGDTLPEAHHDGDARTEIDGLLEAAGYDDVRREVQVGSTPAARVGNTITHLLEREDERTAAILRPTAPLVARSHVDEAAMKLRRHDAVLGPSTAGRVYYGGFAEAIDFEDALEHPALETLTTRAEEAGATADFLPALPSIATPVGLAETVASIRSRQTTGLSVPKRTASVIEELAIRVDPAGEGVVQT
jgi:glycosyltransferase A (GT-A) superfamily protein (DUF2064 family)